MSDEKSLIERLRRTRPGYNEERIWHKFLLDAYAGTGGFQGRIRMPFSGYWGAASELYARDRMPTDLAGIFESEANLDTYLDRFIREDMPKFSRRVGASQYPNYIEPIVDIRLSYMHRKEFVREGADTVVDFLEDADGAGMPWDVMRREIIDTRAALLGWCPVIFDRTQPAGAEPGVQLSVAQATSLGVRTFANALFPANLLDWSTDAHGAFVWAKVVQVSVERPSAMSKAVTVERYAEWTRTGVERWVVVSQLEGEEKGAESVESLGVSEHNHGQVPILIAKHKRAHDDHVRGRPLAGGPSKLARKLFNYLSQFDEHLLSSVFAILQMPVKGEIAGEISIGASNALAVPMDSSRDYKFVSPDASVAESLETRCGKTVEEIYRTGRTEFARAATASGGPESGTARAYAFETSNRAIADFAAAVGAFDQSALRLVSKLQSGAENRSIRTTAPTRFDIEEMSRELDEAMAAITIDLGPTATMELKRRLVAKLLPNLSPEAREHIEAELGEMFADEVRARSAGAEEQAAFAPAEVDENVDDDGDDGDEG